MAKSKAPKTDSKSNAEVQSLSKVKNSSITKPSQTPNAKSKQIAKATAGKINGNPKKAATPSASGSESDSDASESEDEVAKPVTNGKTNGNGVTKEVDTSDSSDSSESGSDASDSDVSDEEKVVASASDDSASESDSESESESESEDEVAPVAVAKDVVMKAVDAGKSAVNGAAKAVAKATASGLSHLREFYPNRILGII